MSSARNRILLCFIQKTDTGTGRTNCTVSTCLKPLCQDNQRCGRVTWGNLGEGSDLGYPFKIKQYKYYSKKTFWLTIIELRARKAFPIIWYSACLAKKRSLPVWLSPVCRACTWRRRRGTPPHPRSPAGCTDRTGAGHSHLREKKQFAKENQEFKGIVSRDFANDFNE